MSNIKSNVALQDFPALAGMLVRKFAPDGVIHFTQEEIDAQPAAFSLHLYQEDGGLTLNYETLEE